VNVVYYPPAISRKEPEWLDSADGPFFLEFDSTIRKLLKEIYTALHNDSRALAVMGICALIEHIMIEQVGDQGGVGSNVDRFIAGGYIAPKSEALFREHLIESGHAAMHRAYFPKPSDISALLDITESLIETIYVHPHRAKGARDSAAKAERESIVIGGTRPTSASGGMRQDLRAEEGSMVTISIIRRPDFTNALVHLTRERSLCCGCDRRAITAGLLDAASKR